jgi:NADH-quinone oxidoreductase subunit N
MIIGNLAAITQDNIKRMLAYSSIGHAGYVLLGIISVSEMGLRGVLVYSVVYVAATLGIWATVLLLQQHEYAGEQVDDFEGLHKRAPWLAFAMIVFLLSLGGIPPTAGFIGKYFLFYAAVGAGFGWLAIVAVLMSAVSMFFYFRIVMAMYLKEGREAQVVSSSGSLKMVVLACALVTLFFGILPSSLIRQAASSGAGVAARSTVLTNAAR